ncbi:MAG TPA: hypothetical protein VGG33_24075 [Polyangia bacterium]
MRMWPRTWIALGASIALHAAVVVAFAGVAVFRGWQVAKKVDIELVSLSTKEVEALPFGPPPPPPGSERLRPGRKPARPRGATANEGVKLAGSDAGADGGVADAGVDAADAGADAGDGGAGGPDGGTRRPRDQKLAGPVGSRLTALLRIDRLRTAPDAEATIAAVDALLRHLPDRRRLLDGTGLDLYRDFDALYVATPNPLDDAVTFLVARHRLTDQAIMAALARGAEAAGRPLTWKTEGGRPVGLRALPTPPADVIGPDGLPVRRRMDRDDRIMLLPERGLAVMAPPAYAALLLGKDNEGGKASEARFRDIVKRIDAEDGALPEDAVLMMSAANPVSSKTARGALPDSAGGVPLGGASGLQLPGFVTMTTALAPAPSLELIAQFEKDEHAAAWAAAWPGWKQTLLGSPLLMFSGFSPLVARADLRQEGSEAVFTTNGSGADLRRLLATIANLIGPARGR